MGIENQQNSEMNLKLFTPALVRANIIIQLAKVEMFIFATVKKIDMEQKEVINKINLPFPKTWLGDWRGFESVTLYQETVELLDLSALL